MPDHPASIGESLQDYARRTGLSLPAAYRLWHMHGSDVAAEWSRTSTAPHADGPHDSEGFANLHCVIAGGRSLGLTRNDVKALVAGRY